ncbi:Uncharacterised protein [Moraxella lacunata]|uniref:Uncharacterized protein n=1 Tax=Moraxella lacunata TaxID=477 RepID=A0A378QFR2_MORLA|nr:Uncharacterised protein [Moraxella lacunata]
MLRLNTWAYSHLQPIGAWATRICQNIRLTTAVIGTISTNSIIALIFIGHDLRGCDKGRVGRDGAVYQNMAELLVSQMNLAIAVRVLVAQSDKQPIKPIIMRLWATHPHRTWVILVSTFVQHRPLIIAKDVVTQMMSGTQ